MPGHTGKEWVTARSGGISFDARASLYLMLLPPVILMPGHTRSYRHARSAGVSFAFDALYLMLLPPVILMPGHTGSYRHARSAGMPFALVLCISCYSHQ